MAELHQKHDLRLNLKFEIEVLCRLLKIEIANLHPGHLLEHSEIMNRLEQQLSTPSVKMDKGQPLMGFGNMGGPSPLPHGQAVQENVQPLMGEDQGTFFQIFLRF